MVYLIHYEFKEINQIGLELIGDIDTYSLCEVLNLAKLSLSQISDSYVLDISHMGLLIGLLESTGLPYDAKEEISGYIGTKNSHEIRRVCSENGVDSSICKKLTTLASLYGSIDKILPEAEKLIVNETTEKAVKELPNNIPIVIKNDIALFIKMQASCVFF